jgi:hypothetical protein
MNIKRSSLILMIFFAAWLFAAAVPGYSQVIVQPDPDEYPWLSFETMTDFQLYMESIIGMSDDDLDAFEETTGFYSMRQAMQCTGSPLVGDDLDNVEFDEFIEDPYLTLSVNPSGIVEIENWLLVITRHIVYRVPEGQHGDIDDLDLFAEIIPPTLPPGVEAYMIERVEAGIEGLDEATVQSGFSTCTNNYASKRRLKGRAWIINWFFYASAGSTSYSEKKVKFLWWKRWRRKRVEWVKVHLDYNITSNPGGNNKSGSVNNTRYNASSATQVVESRFGWNVSITGSISAIHSLKNGGYLPTCVVRIPN